MGPVKLQSVNEHLKKIQEMLLNFNKNIYRLKISDGTLIYYLICHVVQKEKINIHSPFI